MSYLSSCVWLHSVWQSLGPSTLLQMASFGSLLWLSDVPRPLCQSLPCGRLGCFPPGHCKQCCSENWAAGVFLNCFLLGVCPGVRWSYGSSIFSVLRNHHTILHSSWINLHSRQQCWKSPLLHTLSSTYCLQSFWWCPFWPVWVDTSLWFWFAFL